jgi:hypothetical protein
MAYPLPWGERVRVRGKWSNHHPHLNPPPSRGRKVFQRIRCPAALLRGTSLKGVKFEVQICDQLSISHCLKKAKKFNLKSKICNLKWRCNVLFSIGEKMEATGL